MSTIAVTGATGFLGQHVVKRLVSEGFQVTALGRNQAIGDAFPKEVKFVKVSLEDRDGISRAMKNQDYVIHCAALSSVWGNYADFYNANVVGTQNLVDAALFSNVKRFVHVSTPSIYFNLHERTKINLKEDNILPAPAINYYAETKRIAEEVVDEAFKKGLPAITIRPRALFGPGDNAIIPRLIKANEKSGIPFINGGKVLTDITYVENVVDALFLCLSSEMPTLGRKYNITNGEPMYLGDILEKVFLVLNETMRKREIKYERILCIASMLEKTHRLFGIKKEPIITPYTVTVLSHSQTLNIDAAKTELGYQPRISIDEGINRFAEWWNSTK
ncbi:NAD-dependent epimerase/dehydratase family protein [Lysinibacillus yapensis]|uniref:NAD-dependent epimerase/dehydratase family protein n=1 Tax=Ureibacillus yapensis TaxID=2304605 RepID=A0A396S575_9BACL|nr:NAD-dependent epimerase/dehydratase family protein [Lysinibacillus yapensis]RHW34664.1 NAD-dependent epimerase/dehydratase family protein [Lysinibacillus yapensis]